MQYLNLALFLSPVWAPGIFGAWFVLSKPDVASRRRLAVLAMGGAAVFMIVGLAAFLMSPWFSQNNDLATRDVAGVRTVEPFAMAAWAALVAILWFGIGGWCASLVRGGGVLNVAGAFLILLVVPMLLFYGTIILGCFFGGACL